MKNLSVFILIILFVGCSSNPSPIELIETRKNKAEAKFNQFYACYDIAKNTPKLDKDYVNWIPDVLPQVAYKKSNVYQIGIESFKDLSKPLDVHFDGTRRREHADMAQLFNIDLSSKKEPHNYNIDDKYSYHELSEDDDSPCVAAIQHFLNSRYLLINRINEHQEAVLQTEKTFDEGFASGDVLIFDLEKSELIGGFKINAKSQSYISINESSDYDANLKADLEMNIYSQIKERFKDLAPNLKTSGGYDF